MQPKHFPFLRLPLLRPVMRAALAIAVAAAAMTAQAAWPEKPIRVVLGFGAGGGSDILLRTITPAPEGSTSFRIFFTRC